MSHAQGSTDEPESKRRPGSHPEPRVSYKKSSDTLGSADFQDRIVPRIKEWFSQPPDWNYEDDYLPETGTAQGAALAFFRDIDAEALDRLGVDIVEGEHPGSTYYAAELRGDVDEANRKAEAAGLPVRFLVARR